MNKLHSITCGIFYCRVSAEINGCSSPQTSSRFDSDVLRNRQQKHTAVRYAQKNSIDTCNVLRKIKKTGTFILFSSLFFIIGCSKDKQMIVENKWQVESIKVHADSAIQYPSDNIYKLSFRNKKEYNISLDVNSGGGKVKFSGENNVNFEDPWTTFKCCDSKYAEGFVDILIKTETYKMNDSILVLTGEDGELINLKKQ